MTSSKKFRKASLLVIALALTFLVSACNLSGSPERESTLTPAGPTVQVQPSRTPLSNAQLPSPLPAITVQQPTNQAQVASPFPTSVAFATFQRQPTNTPLPESLLIISPGRGNIVAGGVQVRGSASHPNFLQYQLEYGSDPNPNNLWFPVTGIGQTPVLNGLLGVWSTNAIPDGLYQLRFAFIPEEWFRIWQCGCR